LGLLRGGGDSSIDDGQRCGRVAASAMDDRRAWAVGVACRRRRGGRGWRAQRDGTVEAKESHEEDDDGGVVRSGRVVQ
jgi:hypothetical protein